MSSYSLSSLSHIVFLALASTDLAMNNGRLDYSFGMIQSTRIIQSRNAPFVSRKLILRGGEECRIEGYDIDSALKNGQSYLTDWNQTLNELFSILECMIPDENSVGNAKSLETEEFPILLPNLLNDNISHALSTAFELERENNKQVSIELVRLTH